MRSIIIAAAFSCACLPGERIQDLKLSEPVYPASNQSTKSARLDRAVDGGLRAATLFSLRSYVLATADPNAIVVEGARPETDALASTGVTFEQVPEPETTASLPVQPEGRAERSDALIEKSIDSMIVVPRILADPDLAPPISKEALCDTLADAAEDHNIPLVFFNNLIWQESRFKTRAVSPVGAQGVAQFMPYVAARVGLSNPFDPFQALPASARLLKTLYRQFGNFGLAAAAYNVGPKRVSAWLSKRSRLPAETRNYVQVITGRPAEHWRSRTQTAAFRLPARAPCREMPTFALAEEEARRQEIADADAARARAAKEAKTTKLAKQAAPAKDAARFELASKADAKPSAASKTVQIVTKLAASKPLQLVSKKIKAQAAAKKIRTASLKK